jgi:lipopolysaccharide/colanic/teichoic acid biosynthesis glycosyltransferase
VPEGERWESLRHDSGNNQQGLGTAVIGAERERSASLLALLDRGLKRMLDVVVAASLLVLASPLIVALAVAVRLESRGPAFYRCMRVGRHGRVLYMLKFRKMRDGASGPALAAPDDARFTRLGGFLARTKLDEVPQLWNVLKGEMSLVGPRPEDPSFVELHREPYDEILSVRPGITGLSQLAFAREGEILDPDDRVRHYTDKILPQKIRMDRLYAARHSFSMDARILWWTLYAVATRREVAVHRDTGQLNKRAPRQETASEPRSPVLVEHEAS